MIRKLLLSTALATLLTACQEDPNDAARALYVEALQFIDQSNQLREKNADIAQQVTGVRKALASVDKILTDYPSSDLALEISQTRMLRDVPIDDYRKQVDQYDQQIFCSNKPESCLADFIVNFYQTAGKDPKTNLSTWAIDFHLAYLARQLYLYGDREKAKEIINKTSNAQNNFNSVGLIDDTTSKNIIVESVDYFTEVKSMFYYIEVAEFLIKSKNTVLQTELLDAAEAVYPSVEDPIEKMRGLSVIYALQLSLNRQGEAGKSAMELTQLLEQNATSEDIYSLRETLNIMMEYGPEFRFREALDKVEGKSPEWNESSYYSACYKQFAGKSDEATKTAESIMREVNEEDASLVAYIRGIQVSETVDALKCGVDVPQVHLQKLMNASAEAINAAERGGQDNVNVRFAHFATSRFAADHKASLAKLYEVAQAVDAVEDVQAKLINVEGITRGFEEIVDDRLFLDDR